MDFKRFTRLGGAERAPLCMFGPGGDYVNEWPGGNPIEASSAGHGESNGLGKVLDAIADMLNADERGQFARDVGRMARSAGLSFTSFIKETGENEQTHSFEKKAESKRCDLDAEAAAGAGGGSGFSDEPKLFGDDSGACRRTKRRSKHNIRAYNVAGGKGVNYKVARQGTLFEAYGQSQSAA